MFICGVAGAISTCGLAPDAGRIRGKGLESVQPIWSHSLPPQRRTKHGTEGNNRDDRHEANVIHQPYPFILHARTYSALLSDSARRGYGQCRGLPPGIWEVGDVRRQTTLAATNACQATPSPSSCPAILQNGVSIMFPANFGFHTVALTQQRRIFRGRLPRRCA